MIQNFLGLKSLFVFDHDDAPAIQGSSTSAEEDETFGAKVKSKQNFRFSVEDTFGGKFKFLHCSALEKLHFCSFSMYNNYVFS